MTSPLLLLLLLAHELDLTSSPGAGTIVVRAAYAGTDPVPFAKIQVFDPQGQEFQSANMDKRGYFSFVPSTPGSWRVVVDDELGHRRELAVAVQSVTQPATADPAGPASRIERALLGLSLIVGLTGFWYGWRARTSKP